uniref:helicase-related protein n=1 Tax=Armatimonas sp. TaxID=1872638 RepID=UPI00286AABBC
MSKKGERAEIIVATPERLEVLWRSGEASAWLASVRSIVVDEAHLLGDRSRGSTLDAVLGSFLSQPTPPRLLLMSATLTNPTHLQQVLAPCESIVVTERTPPLTIQVALLEGSETAEELVHEHVRTVLEAPGTAILIFVATVRFAESLAEKLAQATGHAAIAYHAQLSTGEKETRSQRYRNGEARIAVSTTALAMGVNLPATHVLVRDTNLQGRGHLTSGELLQMLGRAGRGQGDCISIRQYPLQKRIIPARSQTTILNTHLTGA